MNSQRRRLIEEFFEVNVVFQRLFGSCKDRYLSQYGLSRPQAEILYYVADQQPVTVKQIAQIMKVTSSAATQMIEGLVKLGYLQRENDEADRRIVRISLTTNGQSRFNEFKFHHLEKVNQLLATLTNEELEQLLQLRKKVVQRLEELEDKETA